MRVRTITHAPKHKIDGPYYGSLTVLCVSFVAPAAYMHVEIGVVSVHFSWRVETDGLACCDGFSSFVCCKMGSEMKFLALVTDFEENQEVIHAVIVNPRSRRGRVIKFSRSELQTEEEWQRPFVAKASVLIGDLENGGRVSDVSPEKGSL